MEKMLNDFVEYLSVYKLELYTGQVSSKLFRNV